MTVKIVNAIKIISDNLIVHIQLHYTIDEWIISIHIYDILRFDRSDIW